MEKRKLLLIVISVGVFLVIVIGATMLVFAPKASAPVPGTGDAMAAAGGLSSGPATVDASEWVRDPSAVSGLQEPADRGPADQGPTGQGLTGQSPSGQTQSGRGDVIIIYGDRPSPDSTIATSPVAGDNGLVIQVPAPPSVAVPQPAAIEERAAPAPKQVQAALKKETVKPAPAKTQSVPKKATKIIDDFWVQTGSFSAKARAEAAKETLAAKGIASLVETKDVDGKTFYRVRVGPYASKTEAEYWLSLVKTIDGFGESYVSLAKAKR